MATRSERHIGKLFRIDLGAVEAVALCIWRDEKFGYLLKWFPLDIDADNFDPVLTPEFWYKHIQLDRAIRNGEAKLIRKIEGFSKFRPELRSGGGINPRGGQIPWFISDGTGKKKVEPDDPILPTLSDFSLATLPFMEMLYLENVTPEVYFRRMQAAS